MIGICFMSSSLVFYLERIKAKDRLYIHIKESQRWIQKDLWFGLLLCKCRFTAHGNMSGKEENQDKEFSP